MFTLSDKVVSDWFVSKHLLCLDTTDVAMKPTADDKFIIHNHVHEAYRIRGAKYLVVQGDSTAYWSNTMSTRDHSITEDQLVEQIKFPVENIYIQVGNKIFRQTIGIPMGTDCTHFWQTFFFFTMSTNS